MVTDSTSERGDLATPEQEAELRKLAEAAAEEVPGGMRSGEAAQRIEELKTHQPDAST
jgi:Protein of unknown function (DUF3072)